MKIRKFQQAGTIEVAGTPHKSRKLSDLQSHTEEEAKLEKYYPYGWYTKDGLINADDYTNPWVSDQPGIDAGRYTPTSGHGNFGEHGQHYKYTQSIEEKPIYIRFDKSIFGRDGNFTKTGEAWAKAQDELLPKNHPARFYDENGNLRKSWTVYTNDVHGRKWRSGQQTFNNPRDFVKWLRHDQILGARHNIYPLRRKRHYYTDNNGNKHYIDRSEDVSSFTIKKIDTPIIDGPYTTIDIELVEPENSNPTVSDPEKTKVSGKNQTSKIQEQPNGDTTPELTFLEKLQKTAGQLFPNLLSAIRLNDAIRTNNRIYNQIKNNINPAFQETFNTFRRHTGNEGLRQGYYRRAAEGESKAARTYTSDSDKQLAYQNEAKRVGDDLRAQGDLIDNQEIRRTEEISMDHLDQNIARRTQVYNNNVLAAAQAAKDRSDIEGQRIAANYTSRDNFIKGLENRILTKKQQQDYIQEYIDKLNEQSELEQKLLPINTQLTELYNKSSLTDDEKEEVSKLVRERTKIIRDFKIQSYKNRLNKSYSIFAKQGTKITKKYKQSNDLLYKSARDAVEHFRKMTKLTSDATIKSRQKPIKLIGVPKAKRMQLGGVAPFVVYTPTVVGGERSTSVTGTNPLMAENDEEVSDKKKGKQLSDITKELFNSTLGKALPSDMQVISQNFLNMINKIKLFEKELTDEEIAALYTQQLTLLNNAHYDEALKNAEDNEALDDYAVSGGRFVVQDAQTGKISMADPKSSKDDILNGKLILLKNRDLLRIRSYDVNETFGKGDAGLTDIVKGSIGMSKIAEFIKENTQDIGTDEVKQEGFSSGDAKEIVAGLNLLNKSNPAIVEWGTLTKTQEHQMEAALKYIVAILPNNMRGTLQANADLQGSNIIDIIRSSLLSRTSATVHKTVDYQEGFTKYVFGLGSEKNSNKGEGDDDDGIKYDAATALIFGKGYQEQIELNPKSNWQITATGIYSVLQNHDGSNMGNNVSMQEASKSTVGNLLDWQKATFGGSRIQSSMQNQVIFNTGDVVAVDLPVNSDGTPNIKLLKNLERLDTVLVRKGISDNDWQKVNEECRNLNLPPKYVAKGKLNIKWGRFAAFNAVTNEGVFINKDAILSDIIKEIDEDDIREEYNATVQEKTKNKDFELGNGFLFFGGKTHLYEGTVFVPVRQDKAAALLNAKTQQSMQTVTSKQLEDIGVDREATRVPSPISKNDLKK